MQDLILAQNESLTMSSREISELTGTRQDNVKRAMISLRDKGVISFTQIEENTNSAGRPPVLFMVNKRDSYVVVAQLSPEFTGRLVDRWQELETTPQALPQNYLEALMHLVTKEKQLIEQAPKVAFVDRFVESTGNKSFREVAKILKANEREFRAFLYESKVMYQLGGGWTAHAQHIDAGRFYATAGEANGHAYTSCKFTPKGIEYIAGKWISHKSLE